ncbi:hexokinase4 [Zea mays]|nr:hexokinase4 [Zea mays]
MVVNMEWGNFWSSHLPRTPYDISLDDETQNRNDQGFEKMISGIYLGEIARLVLHRMALESDVFGDAADNLSTPFTLSTPLLAAIRKDDSPDLSEVRRILQDHLKIPDTPLKTRRLVVKVCDIVTRRAARLAAAGIVGILKKLGRDGSGIASSGRTRGQLRRTVVAIEGGLYEGYPEFREYLDEALVEILGEEVARTVTLEVTVDGSGAGAALLAAVHSSNRQQGSI